MARGEPFTPCKLRHDFGPAIPEGMLLITTHKKTGGYCSAYLVEKASGKTLHCTRWPLVEALQSDLPKMGWSWSSR